MIRTTLDGTVCGRGIVTYRNALPHFSKNNLNIMATRTRPDKSHFPGDNINAKPLGRQTALHLGLILTLTINAYALTFVWQTHQFSSQADFAAPLVARKDALLGGATGGDASGSDNGSVVTNHRPARMILQNPKVPDWVKQYAQWHKEQRQQYIESKRNGNDGGNNDVKFLIS